MQIAITGGTGFIGRRLVAYHLERGDRVRLLSRRPAAGLDGGAEVLVADLADPAADLTRFVDGADVLYHCAAQLADETRMFAVHVEGARRLAAAATGRIRRWVQLSSVGVYGPCRSGAVDERTPEAPAGIYETTKAQADAVVTDVARAGAFEHVLLRPTIVYGPDMPNRSLFRLIDAIARGRFFFIGPPGAMVNYVHVSGVVAALAACATRPEARGQTYILSDNQPIERAVGIIASALGRPAPRLRLPLAPVLLAARLLGWLPGFPLTESRVRALSRQVAYDGSRIENELGYRHPVDLARGLGEMVGFLRKRR